MPTDIASKKDQIKVLNDVKKVTAEDVISGKVNLPFTQRSGWRNIQDEDKTLLALKCHMLGGTIPQRRGIKQPELKKLYNLFQHQKLTISQDGLVVKIETDNFGNIKQTIVVYQITSCEVF